MDKNFQNYSMQDAMRMADTEPGQQLLSILQKTDRKVLEKALRQAESGNYSEISSTLQNLLRDPTVRELMRRMEELS